MRQITSRSPVASGYTACVRAFGLGLLLTAVGCIDPGTFVCANSPQCPRGQCIAGDCVIEDPDCDFGRYSKYARPEVAGTCYEPQPVAASSSGEVGSSGTGEGSSSGTNSGSTGNADSSSSSGEPVPVELCNGFDDNDNGLVDEWSPDNERCEVCLGDDNCEWCDLFPDDVEDPSVVYYFCESGSYNHAVSFCTDLNAPFASIHDDLDNTYLAIKVAELAPFARANIGLRNFGEATAPEWTWVDGSTFDYENLGAELTMHDDGDVCVSILTSGEWDATHCSNGQPFICKATLPVD